MNANTSFRCAVIGTGSLLVQSAEELRSRGHAILCVASPDPKVASWAATNKVPHVATWADLESAVRGEKVDLLFSIVNDEVLPPSAMTLPRVMAINYHDAPLPRYAGIHATSWALMAGEKEHAITWHVMSDRVDFGDILVQEHFGIAPDDNALTLNAKCYAAAQRAFRSLLGHLERGTTTRKPQSEAARTFFGRHKRPANAGILDPNTPAQTLENLGRALDFGVYENPLCAARIWTGDRFIVASSIALAESGPHALPGTIINTGPDWLRMAAADGSRDVRLLGLKELDGTPANLTDSRFAVARTLMTPPADALAEIVKVDASAHKHEKKWVARLGAMSPIVMPLISGKPTGESGVLSIDVGSRDASSASALFCAYMARVSRAASFDLLLHTPGQVPAGSAAAALFDTHVPIKIECEPTDATAAFADRVRAAIADAERMGSFARDVAIRFPTLRNVVELKSGAMWHAAIELGATSGAAPRAAITLRADGSGKVSLVFRREIVGEQTARAIAEQFHVLLKSADEGAKTLAGLDFTPAHERTRVLETFNATKTPYETGLRLGDLIRRRVKQHPDAPALVFEGRAVSYAELDGMAWGIAKRLRSLGVKPGTLVGVCVDRSVELVAALVGVAYSGGAYVPLDPGYPADRLVGMCQDAKMPVVLTRGDELARAGAAFQSVPGGVQVVRLDDGPHGKGITPSEPLELVGTEDDPAYVIFTSGSTGRPKGAMNAHKGIVNRLFWMQEAYQLDGRDRVMQKTPYSFDVSVWEFFWPLITGASIVVAKPEGHRDSAYMVELIKRERVTTMHFVPSMLRVFLEERGLESCDSLRRVVCSGEALPTDLVDRFFTRIPHAKLANLYGPTEAAVDVTSWECKPNQPIVPIGKPIANTRMYVLDQELRPLPVGVPGELYIGGVQVGMGYVSRPELTAERFVTDPHNQLNGRMYKTGDLGRWLPDGSIEYLGRIDDQVKIRGFRIELGEIEQVLSKQPGVKDAVVLAREDVPGTKRLVAYVVGTTGDLKAADLKAGLGKHLPEYMVPTAFVFLDHLPVTSNGKLDRRALPAPARGSDESSDRPEDRPSTDVEKTLATIWAEVLRLPTVNATDNFFEIGGDSILSIQICAKARKHNILITPNQIFDHPTIVQLSPHVKLSAAAKIDQGPVTGEALLIPIQKWLLDQPLVRPDQWNAAIMLETPSDVHPGSLERAIQAIVAHHDALRLRFTRGADGSWTSAHAPIGEAVVSMPVIMVERFGTAETDELIQREGGKIQGSLDLAKGPVFSAVLFKARDNSAARLLMVAHHLVLDGLSWRIIVEDLITAHGQASKSQPIALPPKTMSFASWASLLEKHARSPEVQAERPWWAAESATPVARVKRDAQGANVESSSRVHTLHLDESLTRALLYDAPSAHRAQMNDILLAALGVTLRDAAGATRMRIDMMGHGREQIGAEDIDVSRTVGWFTTLFPASLDVGSLDAVGAVEPVRDHLRSIPARGLGYGLLRWMDGADPSLARAENAPISFNYLGQFDQALEPGWNLGVARTRCGPTRDPASPRFYDIEVDVMVVGHRMVVDWTYSANLFKPETIAALADSYRAALVKLSASEPGAGTNSDAFPLAGLSDAGLAKLSALFETTDAQ